MAATSRIREHYVTTRKLARQLKPVAVYHWLVQNGYYPESYVLPPCFAVAAAPRQRKSYYKVSPNGRKFPVPRTELVTVHFPKSALTDRTFGLIEPTIHNDIAFHVSMNWRSIVDAMLPTKSRVASYAFPLPLDARNPGRMGMLRSGRMIYEYIGMIDNDLAAEAYRFRFLVRADIRNFYPSIYTHSIPWAIHGKKSVRKPNRMYDQRLLGNRLDKLFQNANDGCTNGVPIGPVVSDIVAEIVAAGVDTVLTRSLATRGLDCEVVRFKDDYRLLVKSEADGQAAIKHLQSALRAFNLELSDDKTTVSELPNGLFRDWVSLYHLAHPRKRAHFAWDQFRELYLSVLRIDRMLPGTGVIDRFLADIVDDKGRLKVSVGPMNLQRVMSMLLMMASLRVKSFPKVLAIIEIILRSPFGAGRQDEIVQHLAEFLDRLAQDEERNKYLITWIAYFLTSNGLRSKVQNPPQLKDPITRTAWNSRSTIFSDAPDYKLFVGCRTAGRKHNMFEYLDLFNPPSEH